MGCCIRSFGRTQSETVGTRGEREGSAAPERNLVFQAQSDLPPVAQEGRTLEVQHTLLSTDKQSQVCAVGYVVEIVWETLREGVLGDRSQSIQEYLNSTHNLTKSLKETVRDNIQSH